MMGKWKVYFDGRLKLATTELAQIPHRRCLAEEIAAEKKIGRQLCHGILTGGGREPMSQNGYMRSRATAG